MGLLSLLWNRLSVLGGSAEAKHGVPAGAPQLDRANPSKTTGAGSRRLHRFIEGFGVSGDMQAPPGEPGDPQIAALHQYFHTKLELSENDIVLDVGSGLGILPHVMAQVWRGLRHTPCYYAVDLPEILERLALPTNIHNNSRKLAIRVFLEHGLGAAASRVQVVVVRNVLHELDIPATAQVLHSIVATISPGTEVYIQDMARLAKGERGNVGWDPNVLVEVLNVIGLACGQPLQLNSHSGTPWFTVIGHKRADPPSLALCQARIKAARELQRTRVITSLQALNRQSDERTTPEYVMLQAEEASIATQLQQVSYGGSPEQSGVERRRTVSGIPLVAVPLEPLDYVEEISSSNARRSGLVAIISSKNHLDFPALISSCRQRVYFSGYSQRSLLHTIQNRMALQTALRAGAKVRVLLCDPQSKAAAARAEAIAYKNSRDLTGDILNTISEFTDFRDTLDRAGGAYDRCQLRVTDTIPSSAYFILDDLCYVSLYSLRLTGGTGPCLVFRGDPSEVNAYYSVLLQEFELTWDRAQEPGV